MTDNERCDMPPSPEMSETLPKNTEWFFTAVEKHIPLIEKNIPLKNLHI